MKYKEIMTVSELLYKYMDEKSVYVTEGTLSFYKDHIDKLVKYFKKHYDYGYRHD